MENFLNSKLKFTSPTSMKNVFLIFQFKIYFRGPESEGVCRLRAAPSSGLIKILIHRQLLIIPAIFCQSHSTRSWKNLYISRTIITTGTDILTRPISAS